MFQARLDLSAQIILEEARIVTTEMTKAALILDHSPFPEQMVVVEHEEIDLPI
jgi:hypothetical protein